MSMFAGLTLVTPPALEPVSVADILLHGRVTNAADLGMLAGYLATARQECERRSNRAFMPQSWRLALRHWPGRSETIVRQSASLEEYHRWNYIEVPRPPLQSITSFTYQDTAGVVYSMAQGFPSTEGNYLLDTDSEPGRVHLPFSGIWPTRILLPGNPIQITFVGGYKTYAGTVNTDASGLNVTYAGGASFDALMVGTFIQIAGNSSAVLAMPSPTALTLAQGVGANLAAAAYTANSVPHHFKQAILMLASHYYRNREATSEDSVTKIDHAVDALLDIDRNFKTLG